MKHIEQTKNLLLAAGALLTQQAAAETAGGLAQKATPERPNIIFILADDMGYGNLAAENPKLVKQLDAQMHRMHKPSVNYPLPGEFDRPAKKKRR